MADYVPILTFHAIEDSRSVISFRPELFGRFMGKLHRNGYGTLRLSDAAGLVREGKPLPEKSFVITFDDGYRSVYDEAFPVLNKYSMTATVFLTTGGSARAGADERLRPLNGREMLSWGEIREMKDAGIDFGAHTISHPDLTKIETSEIENEMTGSKKIIENKLGASVSSFAYPYGKYDARSLEIARGNFECACSDELGLMTMESGLYALERVDSYYLRRETLFGLMMTKSFPLYVFLRNIPRAMNRSLRRR
ncbi:MAG: polysaccharide deacetylase family protein [Thermodesulfobacteriota bacterium]